MLARGYANLTLDSLETSSRLLGLSGDQLPGALRHTLSYEFSRFAEERSPVSGRTIGKLGMLAGALSGCLSAEDGSSLSEAARDALMDPYVASRHLSDRLRDVYGPKLTQADVASCFAVLEMIAEINGADLLFAMSTQMRTERALTYLEACASQARNACKH